MDISNLSNAEFKTLVMRMLKELSEDLSSKNMIWSEMEDTLAVIKNHLQGNNNRMNEADKQIDDLQHKEAKSNQSQQEEKRIKQN